MGTSNNFYGHFPVRKLLVYHRIPQRAALHALPCPGESHHMDRLKFCNFKYDLTSRGLRRFFFIRGNALVPDIHAASKVLMCLCIIYIMCMCIYLYIYIYIICVCVCVCMCVRVRVVLYGLYCTGVSLKKIWTTPKMLIIYPLIS